MMDAQARQAERVLNVARAMLGYQASRDPLPGSVFGRWAADITGNAYYGAPARRVPYCNLFVSWVFAKAGLGETIGVSGRKVYAYTPAHYTYFRNQSRLVPIREAQPGDIVFFDWHRGGDIVDHVGIVEANLGAGRLRTIEGNTSAGIIGSQTHGGGVYRRTRRNGIKAIARPKWRINHAPNHRKETPMALVQVGPDIYATDGITRRHIKSMETVNAIKESTGATIAHASPDFLRDVPEAHAEARIRDLKDILTGHTAAPPNLVAKIWEKIR